MESSNKAGAFSSISVDLANGTFSIHGQEDFVQKYFEILLPVVQKEQGNGSGIKKPSVQLKPEKPYQQQGMPADDGLVTRCIERGLFYFDDSTGLPFLQARVPGNNKRERMRNVALVLLRAASEPLESSYIKEQCRLQSCFDGPNFSKAYEMDKRDFIKKGKTGSKDWTLQLTVPGKETSEALINRMLQPA